MNNSRFFDARKISYFSILLALVIVLQAFGGSIKFGAVELNFTLIPIVLGAVILGPIAGALLGFACGVIVLIQVIITPTGFYFIIWSMSPVVTILTCIVKTTVAGYVAGVSFKIIKKKNAHVALFVASGIVPVINTALFIVGCLCMNQSIVAFQNTLAGIPDYAHVAGMNIIIFIILILVTFNFFFEFAINLLVVPALHRVLKVIDKSISILPKEVADKVKIKTEDNSENSHFNE